MSCLTTIFLGDIMNFGMFQYDCWGKMPGAKDGLHTLTQDETRTVDCIENIMMALEQLLRMEESTECIVYWQG